MISSKFQKKLDKAKKAAELERPTQEGDDWYTKSKGISSREREAEYVEQKQIVIPMYVEQLKEKISMDSDELIYCLCMRACGFKPLLDSRHLSEESMTIILNALAKACECRLIPEIRKLLLIVLSSEKFFSCHVQSFLHKLKEGSSIKKYGKPMLSLALLLCDIMFFVPNLKPKKEKELEDIVKNICRIFDAGVGNVPSALKRAVQSLELNRKKNKQQVVRETSDGKETSTTISLNEFRGISILPTIEELSTNKVASIRPNITEGPFVNVEDYLDIHFRLLREDFMGPLRQGITSCLISPPQSSKDISVAKRDVINIYTDVHISPQMLWREQGIVHRIQFDPTPFEGISWGDSKRLIYGSLVCISCDDFNTILIAVVVGCTTHTKECECLDFGSIGVHFVDFEDQLTHYDPFKSYVMVESAALYEAYRHNLLVLQNLNEETFPFRRYIVDVMAEVNNVSYVPMDVRYDLSPLRNKEVEEEEVAVVGSEGNIDRAGEITKSRKDSVGNDSCASMEDANGRNIQVVRAFIDKRGASTAEKVEDERDKNEDPEWHLVKQVRRQRNNRRDGQEQLTYKEVESTANAVENDDPLSSIELFNDDCWPRGEELGYDEPQIKAIKGALREEFCLIQGPPGTGKTFITLKIVETILRNRNRKNGNKFQPIVIASYTNHALDQVLEGVLKFTTRIVRLGSQSSSPTVQNYIMRAYRRNRHYQKNEIGDCYKRIWSIRQQFEQVHKFMISVRNEIISYDDMCEHISPSHQQSFESKRKMHILGSDRRDLLALWLVDDDDDDDVLDCTELRSKDASQMGGMESYFEKVENYINQLESMLKKKQNEKRKVKTQVTGVSVLKDNDTIETFKNIDDDNNHYTLSLLNDEESDNKENLNSFAVKTSREIPFAEVYRRLSTTDPMSGEDANKVKNVWKLGIQQKWRLYCYWWRKFVRRNYDKMLELSVAYNKWLQQLRKKLTESDKAAICNEEVIGMTTTGAAKFHDLIELIKPYVVIIEEAAQVFEPHIVTTIKKSTKHVILVGDHQQLRPRPNAIGEEYKLDVSLFERMIENGLVHYRLETQFRMRPCIANLLVPEFYPHLEHAEKVLKYPDVNGVRKSMYFIDHTEMEEKDEVHMTYFNKHEVDFLVALCMYLIQQGYKAYQITILTLYNGQKNRVTEKLKDIPECADVSIANVDGFQGRENDIILISLVRSNDEGIIGFLNNKNRMCVCLSRARIGMYCIGNFELITRKSDLWKGIIRKVEKEEAISDGLPIYCRNHPEKTVWVNTAKRFKKVSPLGGCTRNCGFRYPCGHFCHRHCHPVDQEHQEFKCEVKCKQKLPCPGGHRCNQACHFGEECPPCQMASVKTISLCGHEAKLKCSQNPEKAICQEACGKFLTCGHRCRQACGEECSKFPCTVVVGCTLPCGHGEVSVECGKSSNSDLQSVCINPCRTKLECGHNCQGTCGSCLQGRLHTRCELSCDRLLVCGHQCLSKCGEPCPPCKNPCEVRCEHRRCNRMCGEICHPCLIQCEWQCPHQKCSRPCGDPCDRIPCIERCTLSLDCGHRCMGLCGEPCPSKCKECEFLRSPFICATRKNDDVLYYELENCGHVFPIEELTEYMNYSDPGEIIQMKTCPQCRTPIWKSKRFNSVVFRCLKTSYRIKKRLGQQAEGAGSTRFALYTSLDVRAKPNHKVHELVECLKEHLSHENMRIAQVMILENHMKYAQRLAYVENKMLLATNEFQRKNRIVQFALSYIGFITQFIINNIDSASMQQLHDADREIRRLEVLTMIVDWYQMIHTNLKTDAEFEYDKAVMCLLELAPFLDEHEEQCRKAIANANKLQTGIEYSFYYLEKSKISRALCGIVGDWWKCPNGHIYASLVRYGESNMDSICSECVDTL